MLSPRQYTHNKGFTLVELLVVVAIIAIIAIFAVPSLQTQMANQRIRSGTGQLVNAFSQARSQAILSQATVPMSSSDNKNWSLTYPNITATTPALASVKLPDKVTVTTNLTGGIVSFNPQGQAIYTPANTLLVFRICDPALPGGSGMTVTLNNFGLARYVYGPITSGAGTTGAAACP